MPRRITGIIKSGKHDLKTYWIPHDFLPNPNGVFFLFPDILFFRHFVRIGY
jgi:hypothetical protein